MAQEENKAPVRSSIINYVENFLDKRNLELRASTGDESDSSATQEINKDSIVIRAAGDDGYRRDLFDSQQSASTDIDADDLNLDSDPIVETHEGGEQVYKQQVFLRQYQPPTPEPIDIQVQEVAVKPQIQRAPIHVHVGPAANRETQRTPSPILIKSAPPPAPPATEETVFYNKYVPLETKPLPQQIIIHRYPELPPKPRPIVVEQWLPNKPAPKRITYHHINPEEYAQNETRRSRNRFIEYKKPHTTIEVEIIRLPIVKLKPEEYGNRSPQLTRLDQVRSMTQDPNTLNWRI